MKFRFDGNNYMVRLEKGEKLIESLTKLVKEQKIPSSWISGLGGAQWAEIGFYHLDEQRYDWQKIGEPTEIVSLQGNITWTGTEPAFHIHGSFAQTNLQVIGGHVREIEISGTCELLLRRWYGENLTKTIDPITGLKVLDL